jgi:hypothetical protein
MTAARKQVTLRRPVDRKTPTAAGTASSFAPKPGRRRQKGSEANLENP